jgi:hypothetical protein
MLFEELIVLHVIKLFLALRRSLITRSLNLTSGYFTSEDDDIIISYDEQYQTQMVLKTGTADLSGVFCSPKSSIF